jgi:hypothetical protein
VHAGQSVDKCALAIREKPAQMAVRRIEEIGKTKPTNEN